MSPRSVRRPFSVRIHPLSCLPLLLLLFFNTRATFLIIALCVLCHEAGHVALAALQHRRIFSVALTPFGLELRTESVPFSYRADVCLHLAGAGSNLLFAAVTCLFIRSHPGELRFFAFYLHLVLAAFQLLPIRSLDGGHALYAYLCSRLSLERADRLSERISRWTLLLFTALCGFLFWKSGFHLSFCASGVFLLASFWQKPDGAGGGKKDSRRAAGIPEKEFILRPSLRQPSSARPFSARERRPSSHSAFW